MLFWYDALYVGEEAKKQQKKTMRDLENGKFVPGVYLISPSKMQDSLMDIYPAYTLLQPYYKKHDVEIIGLAIGYEEALTQMQKMLMECYENTGGMDFLRWVYDQGSFQRS
ncbi:MAG: hypothetical protein E7269_07955 [Lachnospiraceae bacterium]|nr:hypothetical protein [Lachnospiraceae bacterium]